MKQTLKELKAWFVQWHDPEELVKLLDISTEELVEAFEEKLIEYSETTELDIED